VMSRRVSAAQLGAWREGAIQRMTRSREATLRFLVGVPERELLRPCTQGRWSVKDVLAHIAAWEEEALRRFALIARGRGDRIFFYDTDPRAVDRFNAHAVAAARPLTLGGVLRRLHRVRTRLIERLRRLPAASLRNPAHRYPVTAWLPEYAWTHERDHLRRMRGWWKGQRAGKTGGSGGRGRSPRARTAGRGETSGRPRVA
ncbi:MAG: DinB family protein, partial [candidate division NC10 bacterium]|nr:DinB family protein [candidate division NC10 bacterium]